MGPENIGRAKEVPHDDHSLRTVSAVEGALAEGAWVADKERNLPSKKPTFDQVAQESRAAKPLTSEETAAREVAKFEAGEALKRLEASAEQAEAELAKLKADQAAALEKINVLTVAIKKTSDQNMIADRTKLSAEEDALASEVLTKVIDVAKLKDELNTSRTRFLMVHGGETPQQ